MDKDINEILSEMLSECVQQTDVIQSLLQTIDKAYEICQTRQPQFPGKEWQQNDLLIPFSKGNKKLPKSTYVINLGCSSLCPGRALGTCKQCGICYAYKAELQYQEGTVAKRLLQTIRWRQKTPEQIANQLLQASNRSSKNKMKHLRFNESGDVFDENDIRKMSRIADILADEGITTYVYTSRNDLDWTIKSPNLIVNGSGWMCDNEFKVVTKLTDDMEYQCHGECGNCDYCKEKRGITICVAVH